MRMLCVCILLLLSCAGSSENNDVFNDHAVIYYSRYNPEGSSYKWIRTIFKNKTFSWKKQSATDSTTVDSLSLSDDAWKSIISSVKQSSLDAIKESAECGKEREAYVVFLNGKTYGFDFKINSSDDMIKNHVKGIDKTCLNLISSLRHTVLQKHPTK